MNTARRAAPAIGTLVVAGLCIALLAMVYWYAQNGDATVPVAQSITPRVTSTAKPTRIIEPTGTPPPNYHGTQAALDSAIATHQAGIDEAMRKATGTAEALAIEHQAEVYAVDVSIAQTRLSGAIDDYEYGILLHTIGISQAAVMAQDEINFAARRQIWGNNIWLTWNLAFLAGAGLVVLGVCFAVGWQWWIANKPPMEPPIKAEPTKVVEVSEDKKSQKFKELPSHLPGFHTWAACVVKETTLSHRYWAVDENTKQFTDPEYRGLCETMRASEWVRYVNPDATSQGQYLTESGRRVLVAWLGDMEQV